MDLISTTINTILFLGLLYISHVNDKRIRVLQEEVKSLKEKLEDKDNKEK